MRSEILNTKLGEQITIVKPIGRGRLGTVFAGVHPVLARRFAVKVLLPRLTKSDSVQRRLRRMVREASTVQHTAVVPLLDFGNLPDGRVYLTMDFIRGIQLTKALDRDGRLEVPRAVTLLVQLADALEAAHSLRVFHGDVKPNNILLFEERDGSEALRLYDFKLMQALSGEPTDEDPLAHLRLYGNFDYLAPEQINNTRVDGRADIYAYGAVAYRMLCGEPPFFGTPEEVIQGHRSRDPVPPSRRAGVQDVPSELDAIVLRCLEKRPEDRFKTMDEVSRELRQLMPRAEPEQAEEEITGRWRIPPEVEEEVEEPLPESPARLRQLFYDTLVELAEHVAGQGTAAEELSQELGAVERIKEEASQVASEAALTENRFEDIRRELRERESTLRYAIIDLNLAKADLQDRGPEDDDLKDIEFQIAELERSLTDLERQRGERFDRLNEQLKQSRERLKAMEQEIAVHYRRLYAALDEARPEVQTDEARKLYRLLERCRAALTQVTAGGGGKG